MRRGSRSLALLLSPVLVLGCSGGRLPQAEPAPRSVVLEEPPIWNAAVAWDLGEERLLVLDPGGHRLLSYSRAGRRVGALDLDPLAELDYSRPVRLVATDEGYLLGGGKKLLYLTAALDGGRAVDLWQRLAADDIEDGLLNDFVPAGDGLIGFADFKRRGEEWRRGFVRIDLERPRLESVLELPLEEPEFSRYYFYDRRPYVARLGRRTLALRYTEPAAIHRFRARGLEHRFDAGAAGLEAVSIHAWNDVLYLLLASRSQAAEAAGLVEAGLPPDVVAAQVRALGGEEGEPASRRWVLLALDPDTGRRLGEIPLPTTAERVHLVPGNRDWALVGESRPTPERPESRLSLLLIAARDLPGRRR